MNIRENYEDLEINLLSPQASKSKYSIGRKNFEQKCDIRTEFQRDRDRIIHSKAFRRLIHKTQVFLSPEGDHYRTRLTHTLEVTQISRTIARAMRLNEDLTEAIGLGHDLGHTPFGHTGEKTLNEILQTGFRHNEQSLKVVDFLETKNGRQGLNLTAEVRDGILNHTGSVKPFTLEGQIVKLSDRIAYINHDIDDAIRAGIISMDDIPSDLLKVLGYTHSERINTMIMDVIKNSTNKPDICMSNDVSEATLKLRSFLFENIYLNSIAKAEDEKAKFILIKLYDYYMSNLKSMPKYYYDLYVDYKMSKEEIIKDYISGMTDRYAIKLFKQIYLPNPWNK